MYAEAYAEEPFVELCWTRPPGVLEVRETNFCRVFAAADEHTGKVIAFGRSTTSGREPPRRPCRTST